MLRMPGKNGIELERQLVANHSEIPVIFITAHEEETARAQALEASKGATDFGEYFVYFSFFLMAAA